MPWEYCRCHSVLLADGVHPDQISQGDQLLPLRRSGLPAPRYVPGKRKARASLESTRGWPTPSVWAGHTRRPIASHDPGKAEPQSKPQHKPSLSSFWSASTTSPLQGQSRLLAWLDLPTPSHRIVSHMLHNTTPTSWRPHPSSFPLPTPCSPHSRPSHRPCDGSPPPCPPPQMALHDHHARRASQPSPPNPRSLPPWTWPSR